MNLSFDLKKRHAGLKRNIKFDEDDRGLYMDIKLNEKSDWKRVNPAQASAAKAAGGRNPPRALDKMSLRAC